MGKVTQLGDFENQNNYQLWIFETKIKSKIKLFWKLYLNNFKIMSFYYIYNNFIWVIYDFSFQAWMLYKRIE